MTLINLNNLYILKLYCIMKIITFNLLFFFSLLQMNLAFAQFQHLNLSDASPTAASLSKFQEIPVSLYTGIPNVNLPLYNLKQNDIELPISLNYHASGIKPDDHPGWVGLNWSLNAGGVITRVVKDLPDDYDAPSTKLAPLYTNLMFLNTQFNYMEYGPSAGRAGYYFFANDMKSNFYFNEYQVSYNYFLEDFENPEWIKNSVLNNLDLIDTEPDIFKFNFLGYSGEFYLNENGYWIVKSDNSIAVIFEQNNFIDLPPEIQTSREKLKYVHCLKREQNIKNFGGFTLVTEDGTRYVFGNNTDAIEYSIPYFTQARDHWTAVSWYLTKIISPTGKEIELKYEPGSYNCNMYVSFKWDFKLLLDGNDNVLVDLHGNTYSFEGYNNSSEEYCSWIFPRYGSYWGSLIRPTYLKSIESNNASIDFYSSRSEQLLYSDEVFYSNQLIYQQDIGLTPYESACKRATGDPNSNEPFPYLFDKFGSKLSYVNDHEWRKLDKIVIKSKHNSEYRYSIHFNYNNKITERLFLQNVSRLCENNYDLLYSFDYYDDASIVLPDYFVESIDHWGFFNGNTTKTFTKNRTYEYVMNIWPEYGGYYQRRQPTNQLNIALEGSLRTIKSPTKGITTFTYEQNRFSQILNDERDGTITQNGIAGGLRVKNIKYDPLEGNTISKSYYYLTDFKPSLNTDNLVSSGILGGGHQYDWIDINTQTNDNQVHKVIMNVISSQSVSPISYNSQGSHIGYSEVTEVLSDNSFTTFKFTNFSDENGSHFDEKSVGDWTETTPHKPYSDRSIERGKLLSKKTFNSIEEAISSEEYEYEILNEHFAKGVYLYSENYSIPGNFSGPIPGEYLADAFLSYFGFSYRLYSHKYKVNRIAERFINNSGVNSVEKIKTVKYNENSFVSEEEYYFSDKPNLKYLTSYKYCTDYGNIGLLNSKIFNTMSRRLLVGLPIEIINYKDDKIIGAMLNDFSCYGNCQLTSDNLYFDGGNILTNKVYKLNTVEPLNTSNFVETTSSISGINFDTRYYEKEIEFKYDKYHNIKEIKSKNGLVSSFIWGNNGS